MRFLQWSVFLASVTCKRQSAKLGEQITAPLPIVRVSSDSDRIIYPFAAVGLDYFGPPYVKMRPKTRSKRDPSLNKPYRCIFTCLSYRAVHIEVPEDLSTDSFIRAILRFEGRRGPPTVIYSDNGTNFRGAELDVVKTLKAWDQEKVQASLTQRGIDWKFNPPAASHQGGVWDIQKNQKNLTLTGRRPSCYWWAIEDPFGGQGEDFKRQAHHTCLKWPSRFRASNAKPHSSPASEFVLIPQTRLRNVIDLKLDGSMFRYFRTRFRRGGLQNTCLLSRKTKSGCNRSRTSNWKTWYCSQIRIYHMVSGLRPWLSKRFRTAKVWCARLLSEQRTEFTKETSTSSVG